MEAPHVDALSGASGEQSAAEKLANAQAGIAIEEIPRRFRRGIAWNTIATVASQGTTFVSNMLIAALVGQVAFGRYGMALSTIQLTSAFAGLSLGYTATRYLAELRDEAPERAGRVYGNASRGTTILAVAVSGILAALAGSIADHVLNAPDLAPLLRIAAAGVLFSTLNGFRFGVLGGLEAYRALARTSITAGACYLLLCVGGAFAAGVEGAVTGLVASAAIQWWLLGREVRSALKRCAIEASTEFGPEEAAIVRRFVLPGAISGLTATPALWTAQAILARSRSGFSEMALYVAAFNLMMLVLFLPNVANTVGMTLLNHVLGRRDGALFKDVFWMNLWSSLLIALIGALGMLLIAPWLLRAYGPGFRAALPVLGILLAAALPEALTIALNQLLQSRERMWTAIIWVNIPRDSIIVLGALVLAPRYGARGLAAAYLVGRLTALIAIAIAAYRMGGPRISAVPQPREALA